jgi:hypothetical protein
MTTVTAPAGSPLAGPTGIAIVFAARQRGTSVHGLVRISAAGAGYRMTVSVLAPRRALSHAHRGGSVEVGRAGVATLKTGTVHVAVRLDTAARRALARGRRLLLTVEVVLSRTGGERVLVARHVLLRP